MLIDEHDRRVSFGEFRAWSERVAAGLVGLGVARGHARRRGSCRPASRRSCCRSRWPALGAMQNPIIPIYREREVGVGARAGRGARSSPCPACGATSTTRRWRGPAGRRPAPFEVLVVDDALPEGDPSGDPAACRRRRPTATPVRWLYSTSGTTAAPKCVLHTDGGADRRRDRARRTRCDRSADDVGSIAFPCTHIGGPDYLVMMLALRHAGGAARDVRARRARWRCSRATASRMAGGSTAFYLAFLNEQRKQPGEAGDPVAAAAQRRRRAEAARGVPRGAAPRCTSRSATATA